jgi:serine/threonine-protein kinase
MDEALALPSSEWEWFCQKQDQADAELGGMLRTLLKAHADAEAKGFLERTIAPESVLPAGDDAAGDSIQPKLSGFQLGPYRLVRKLGDGGMSTVWLAERDHGNFKRQVALKCLPAFLANPAFKERLLREAMILGRLSHPGIAQLLDAGLSPEGEPYIALELVDGEPITSYCDRLKLDLRSRVRLVAEACEAVAFLHSHSVVHRDIKPTNVFVTQAGRVKLLDFGIAKLMDDVGSDATHASAMAFTPEYAAPEQVNGGAVTTSTDVYALGVLLYKLLTGARPYGRNRSPMLVASEVLNTSPSRPSTLFWATGGLGAEEAKRIAEVRNATVKQLRVGLQDDLDNILLKCLEKEGVRRYSTVEALRIDLLAHLESRPVQARPQSILYLLRKFARRNRGGVLAGGLAAAGIVSAIGFGAWQARLTQLEAENTRRVLSFLQTLIAEANPSNTGIETITVLDLLKRAPDIAKKQFPENPTLQYEMLKPVEAILRELGSMQPLEAVQSEMVRLLDAGASSSIEESDGRRLSHAFTLIEGERAAEGDAIVEAVLKRLEATRRTDTMTYSRALMFKANFLMLTRRTVEASEFAKRSYELAMKLLPPGDKLRIEAASKVVGTLIAGYQIVDAAEIAKQELLPEYVDREPRANVRFEYRMLNATVAVNLGDVRAASQQYDELIEEGRRLYGGQQNIFVYLLVISARAHVEAGRYSRAVELLQEAQSIIRKGELASDTMAVVNTNSDLALALIYAGAIGDAKANLELAASALPKGRPGDTPYQRASYVVALAQRDFDAAGRALDRWEKNFPPTIPVTDMNRVRIALERANLLRLTGQAKPALDIFRVAIENARAKLPPNHYHLARADLLYALTLADSGDLAAAGSLATSANQRVAASLGSDHPLVLQSEFILGEIERVASKTSGEARSQRAAIAYESKMNRPIRESLWLLH